MGYFEQHDRYMKKVAEQHEPFKVNVPAGRSGDWVVDHFTVEPSIEQMRCALQGRPVPLGRYTRLSKLNGPGLFMTDTPAELNDARGLFWRARGHVLITGLGLGMIPRALFNPEIGKYDGNPGDVTHVTIVEKDQDVINLVGPTLADLPVTIVHADAFEWLPKKGTRFDWAWHDIWPDICSDNIPAFGKLRRHYQCCMAAPERQLVWAEAEALDARRRWG